MTHARCRAPRGYTIIENAVAMLVLAVAAAGTMGLNGQTGRFFAEAKHATRAAQAAQDLITQIQLWSFDDPLLAEVSTTNDPGDPANLFGSSADPVGDGIADVDITPYGSSPAAYRMLYDPSLVAGGSLSNGTTGGVASMQAYLVISQTDSAGNALDANGNGIIDAKRIGVIVRWPAPGGWRRVVYVTTKRNPAEAL